MSEAANVLCHVLKFRISSQVFFTFAKSSWGSGLIWRRYPCLEFVVILPSGTPVDRRNTALWGSERKARISTRYLHNGEGNCRI